MKKIFLCAVSAIVCLIFTNHAVGETVLLSTKLGGSIGDFDFLPADLVLYDTESESASVYFPQSRLTQFEDEDIDLDAAHLSDTGTLLLSFRRRTMFDDILLQPRDLIEYDFETDSIVQLHSFNADVSAIDVLPNGHWLFSTKTDSSIADLSYSNGDIVEYDPVEQTASLFLSSSVFNKEVYDYVSIDAIDMLDNERILISTSSTIQIGTEKFRDGDIFEYNVSTNQAVGFLDEKAVFTDLFQDVKAFHVVVPGDFNVDGVVDIADIDFYSGKIGLTTVDAAFDARLDLDADGTIELEDHNAHINNYVQTSNGVTGALLGDINLDGSVDVLSDAFALVAGLNSDAPFSYGTGDLNGDQQVNVLDDAFILLGNLGLSTSLTSGSVSTSSIPEPGSLTLYVLAAMSACVKRTRTKYHRNPLVMSVLPQAIEFS